MSKAEQEDKLQHLLNDRSLLRQKQSFNTLHGRAQADAATELGGRFREALPTPTVVGASPISYPKMPANSPFAKSLDKIVGREPPLGYEINFVDIGESAASSLAADSASVLSTDGADAVEAPGRSNPPGSTASSSTKLRRL
jgi:hypothetical protein